MSEKEKLKEEEITDDDFIVEIFGTLKKELEKAKKEDNGKRNNS